ncbi:MAG TPA: IPTL-CTERM sorting domain-containing protein [Thermoanaerobaculia bacterium]|jgi:hypothetical protein|nr:IPTL-CTERM sorting domain-containing protein [Thermoanaerobaculia bacterium]
MATARVPRHDAATGSLHAAALPLEGEPMPRRTLLLAVACATLVAAPAIRANTYTVTNTNDSGGGSLRQAMLDANSNPGIDTIAFDLAGCPGTPPVCTIAPATVLPILTQPVTIDGYLNGMGTPNTNLVGAGLDTVLGVEINLASTGCIDMRGGGSMIRGLVLNRSPNYAICLSVLTDNHVEGNFIGTNPDGTAAGPGNTNGVAATSDDNVIGGNTPAARNLISGNTATGVQIGNGLANAPATNNARNTKVAGNLIGTDRSGTVAVTQGIGVVVNMDSASFSGRASSIGGLGAGDRNVISGNTDQGIAIGGGSSLGPGDNDVLGNFVGTDVTGTLAVPNGDGISVGGFNTGNAIQSNLVSGNTRVGLTLGSDGNVAGQNRIGTDVSGTLPLPNGLDGVRVDVGDNNLVGSNVIAYNLTAGVSVGALDPTTHGAAILANSIHSNGLRGIELVGTANQSQMHPGITSAAISSGTLTVSGTLASVASTSFRIQVFSNATCDPSGFGEGQSYLGETTVGTDGSGNAAWGPLALAIPPGQARITATATAVLALDSSEFSSCFTAAGGTTNTPPVALADAYATPMNTALNIAAPGVLGNDTDADANPLTAVLDTPPATGLLTLNPNGSFVYTPPLGFSGLVSFTYHASDGTASSAAVVVSIDVQDVAPPAPPPIPTLSQWGLLALAAGLAVAGLFAVRRG